MKKSKFARKLDFGEPEEESGKRQSKILKKGRSIETLAYYADTSYRILRGHRRTDSVENPFSPAYQELLSKKNTKGRTTKNIFDVLPSCIESKSGSQKITKWLIDKNKEPSKNVSENSSGKENVDQEPKIIPICSKCGKGSQKNSKWVVENFDNEKKARNVVNNTEKESDEEKQNNSKAINESACSLESVGKQNNYTISECNEKKVNTKFGLSPRHCKWQEQECPSKKDSTAIRKLFTIEENALVSPSFIATSPCAKKEKRRRREKETDLISSPSVISSPSLLRPRRRTKKVDFKPVPEEAAEIIGISADLVGSPENVALSKSKETFLRLEKGCSASPKSSALEISGIDNLSQSETSTNITLSPIIVNITKLRKKSQESSHKSLNSIEPMEELPQNELILSASPEVLKTKGNVSSNGEHLEEDQSDALSQVIIPCTVMNRKSRSLKTEAKKKKGVEMNLLDKATTQDWIIPATIIPEWKPKKIKKQKIKNAEETKISEENPSFSQDSIIPCTDFIDIPKKSKRKITCLSSPSSKCKIEENRVYDYGSIIANVLQNIGVEEKSEEQLISSKENEERTKTGNKYSVVEKGQIHKKPGCSTVKISLEESIKTQGTRNKVKTKLPKEEMAETEKVYDYGKVIANILEDIGVPIDEETKKILSTSKKKTKNELDKTETDGIRKEMAQEEKKSEVFFGSPDKFLNQQRPSSPIVASNVVALREENIEKGQEYDYGGIITDILQDIGAPIDEETKKILLTTKKKSKNELDKTETDKMRKKMDQEEKKTEVFFGFPGESLKQQRPCSPIVASYVVALREENIEKSQQYDYGGIITDILQDIGAPIDDETKQILSTSKKRPKNELDKTETDKMRKEMAQEEKKSEVFCGFPGESLKQQRPCSPIVASNVVALREENIEKSQEYDYGGIITNILQDMGVVIDEETEKILSSSKKKNRNNSKNNASYCQDEKRTDKSFSDEKCEEAIKESYIQTVGNSLKPPDSPILSLNVESKHEKQVYGYGGIITDILQDMGVVVDVGNEKIFSSSKNKNGSLTNNDASYCQNEKVGNKSWSNEKNEEEIEETIMETVENGMKPPDSPILSLNLDEKQETKVYDYGRIITNILEDMGVPIDEETEKILSSSKKKNGNLNSNDASYCQDDKLGNKSFSNEKNEEEIEETIKETIDNSMKLPDSPILSLNLEEKQETKVYDYGGIISNILEDMGVPIDKETEKILSSSKKKKRSLTKNDTNYCQDDKLGNKSFSNEKNEEKIEETIKETFEDIKKRPESPVLSCSLEEKQETKVYDYGGVITNILEEMGVPIDKETEKILSSSKKKNDKKTNESGTVITSGRQKMSKNQKKIEETKPQNAFLLPNESSYVQKQNPGSDSEEFEEGEKERIYDYGKTISNILQEMGITTDEETKKILSSSKNEKQIESSCSKEKKQQKKASKEQKITNTPEKEKDLKPNRVLSPVVVGKLRRKNRPGNEPRSLGSSENPFGPVIESIKKRKLGKENNEDCREDCAGKNDMDVERKATARLTTGECLDTQKIEEFDTETLHLAPNTKSEDWPLNNGLSEILSEERMQNAEAVGSEDVHFFKIKKKKKMKKGSLLAEYQAIKKKMESERRVANYERMKALGRLPGGKEFQVRRIVSSDPFLLKAIQEEGGEAELVIPSSLVDSSNSIFPGCYVTIFPPWEELKIEGVRTKYYSIRTCDVRVEKQSPPKPKTSVLKELPVAPYLMEPDRLARVLLGLAVSPT